VEQRWILAVARDCDVLNGILYFVDAAWNAKVLKGKEQEQIPEQEQAEDAALNSDEEREDLKMAEQDVSMLKIYVPEAHTEQLIYEHHVMPWGGHLKTTKVLGKLQVRYYWPRMRAQVERFMKTCQECAERAGQGRKYTPPLGDMPLPTEPWVVVGMDILKLSPTLSGNLYALIVTCLFSKWTLAFAMEDQRAKTVCEILVKQIMPREGIPRVVLSDQGGQFTGKLMTEIRKFLGVDQLTTMTFHPQSNGQTERYNRTLLDMLSKVSNRATDCWDEVLPYVVFAYNTGKQTSAGYSPFLLMFG
jgi:hypothetical protein